MMILSRDWSQYDRLSFPVYRLASMSQFEIYQGFQFIESVQTQAYIDRLGSVPDPQLASLDYVFKSYVQDGDGQTDVDL